MFLIIQSQGFSSKTSHPPWQSRICFVGVLTDRELSRKIGVSWRAIWKYRARYDIAARSRSGPDGRPPFAGRQARILDAHRALLGTVPDPDVATQTGVSASFIFRYRQHHGIAGFDWNQHLAENGRRVTAPPAVPATPMRATSQDSGPRRIELFRIHTGDVFSFVAAPTLAEAILIQPDADRAERFDSAWL